MPLVSKAFGDIITFTRASTGTYFDATGTLQSAAIDAPRLDYNPATLAAQGLLIEEARTNLVTRSEEFNDAAWTKTNSSITANATTAPSGTATADKLIEALDTNLVHQATQSGLTIVSLATYTASVFVKADTRTRFRVGFLVGASGVIADANLTAGTISAASAFGGGTAVASSIQAISNGWYRISVAGNGAAGTSGELRVELLDASGNRQYNGDGTSGLFIWGAQLEAGAFPTSYIPTTTTALTRSADVASVNTLSPWFNATEGTIYTEMQKVAVETIGFPRANCFHDGTISNAIQIVWNNSVSRFYGDVQVGALSQADLGANGTTQTNVNKIAFGYKTNDFGASVNGASATTDVSGSLPSGITTFRLGAAAGGSGQINGYLRRITYYPRKLSSAELQAITA